jgi:hypothetical protein
VTVRTQRFFDTVFADDLVAVDRFLVEADLALAEADFLAGMISAS